jgi:hypothetical protein
MSIVLTLLYGRVLFLTGEGRCGLNGGSMRALPLASTFPRLASKEEVVTTVTIGGFSVTVRPKDYSKAPDIERKRVRKVRKLRIAV